MPSQDHQSFRSPSGPPPSVPALSYHPANAEPAEDVELKLNKAFDVLFMKVEQGNGSKGMKFMP
jgi:hypothetical protein